MDSPSVQDRCSRAGEFVYKREVDVLFYDPEFVILGNEALELLGKEGLLLFLMPHKKPPYVIFPKQMIA